MALVDFLGETSEIKIIDFLAENIDREYNQTELSNYIGLSRTTIHEKLPKLIHNKIIKISDEYGQTKFFTLEENDIVEHLIAAVMTHSFAMAEEELEDEEAITLIERKLEMSTEEELSKFFELSTSDIELGVPTSTGKGRVVLDIMVLTQTGTTKIAGDVMSEMKKNAKIEKIPLVVPA